VLAFPLPTLCSFLNRKNDFCDRRVQRSVQRQFLGHRRVAENGRGNDDSQRTNTYTGETEINGGMLRLGSNTALSAGSALTLTSGTLDLNDYSVTVASFSGAAATVLDLVSGTLTSNGSFAHAGSISGTGGLAFTGTGTRTF
jgi:autotransporter family porin